MLIQNEAKHLNVSFWFGKFNSALAGTKMLLHHWKPWKKLLKIGRLNFILNYILYYQVYEYWQKSVALDSFPCFYVYFTLWNIIISVNIVFSF